MNKKMRTKEFVKAANALAEKYAWSGGDPEMHGSAFNKSRSKHNKSKYTPASPKAILRKGSKTLLMNAGSWNKDSIVNLLENDDFAVIRAIKLLLKIHVEMNKTFVTPPADLKVQHPFGSYSDKEFANSVISFYDRKKYVTEKQLKALRSIAKRNTTTLMLVANFKLFYSTSSKKHY